MYGAAAQIDWPATLAVGCLVLAAVAGAGAWVWRARRRRSVRRPLLCRPTIVAGHTVRRREPSDRIFSEDPAEETEPEADRAPA
jgi:hypothetical protein